MLDRFEGSAGGVAAPAPRRPLLGRAKADAHVVAEAMFRTGADSCRRGNNRGDQVGTVVSPKGRAVPVAIRRARARANQPMKLHDEQATSFF